MLILSRNEEDKVILLVEGHVIGEIVICNVQGKKVSIGFDKFDPSVVIKREELIHRRSKD